MCKSPLHPFLHRLPKCEHHIHIEGSLQPTTLFALAARNNISLPSDDPAFTSPTTLLARYSRFTNLNDFLHYYYLGMSCLITQSDYYDLCYTYLTRAHADGVVHAEISFDPQAHVSRGVSFTTVLTGLREACVAAEKAFGITSALICCFLRHLPVSDAETLFHSTDVQSAFRTGVTPAGEETETGDILGIGLDSSEAGYPASLFSQLWQQAQALGLRTTMHAGEEGAGAESTDNIETAVFSIGCSRIDHGRLITRSPSLLTRVAERGTLLTLCPLSNVALRGVSSVSELPIRKFLEKGIKFSINSDDPAYFGGFVLDNYCAVAEAFPEMGVGEWVRVCEGAIEGSWCGRERKEEMRGLLRSVEREFEGLV